MPSVHEIARAKNLVVKLSIILQTNDVMLAEGKIKMIDSQRNFEMFSFSPIMFFSMRIFSIDVMVNSEPKPNMSEFMPTNFGSIQIDNIKSIAPKI